MAERMDDGVLNRYLSGKGAAQKKMEVLRSLRRILSKSEVPPVQAALHAGAIPILVQCLSYGSPDEQTLPVFKLWTPQSFNSILDWPSCSQEKSSAPVAEQCAWALGNVAGEDEELRNILLAQGTLLPLARMMMSNKGSTARTAAWALSNLIKTTNINPMSYNKLFGHLTFSRVSKTSDIPMQTFHEQLPDSTEAPIHDSH
ncbi:Importin subunit alpha-2 [Acorus gramineus]|uniref:Importin subunit alpha-2 n=1 Tax=Acorus gramineus TaxID=55184 RepID=A0AAV9BBH6_ACOGR|nr:Importin subunit alpha-2 [Acorus gramineus]